MFAFLLLFFTGVSAEYPKPKLPELHSSRYLYCSTYETCKVKAHRGVEICDDEKDEARKSCEASCIADKIKSCDPGHENCKKDASKSCDDLSDSNDCIKDVEKQAKSCDPEAEKTKVCNDALNKCKERQAEQKTCEEARKEYVDNRKEKNTKCSALGSSSCKNYIDNCNDCRAGEGESCAEDSYYANDSPKQCPALSGEALSRVKKKHEEAEDKKSDLEKEITGIEDDISTQKSEMLTEQAEYREDKATFEKESKEALQALEDAFKEQTSSIDKGVQESVAKVKEALDESLRLKFEFENKVRDLNRNRALEYRKLYESCRHQASADLGKYRDKRRRAFARGGLSRVKKAMVYTSVSFSKKDQAFYQRYYSRCLKNRRPEMKAIKDSYRDGMRSLEQQRQLLNQKYKSMKDQLQQLNLQAVKEKTDVTKNFFQKKQAALQASFAQQSIQDKNYQASMSKMGNDVKTLEQKLYKLKLQLEETTRFYRFYREQVMRYEMDGVTEKDSQKTNMIDAMAAFANYEESKDQLSSSCNCEQTSSSNTEAGKKYKACDMISGGGSSRRSGSRRRRGGDDEGNR